MVFNVMHNETATGLVINNNQLSEAEKNLYQQQIDLLKEQVEYLKKMLDTVLKSEAFLFCQFYIIKQIPK